MESIKRFTADFGLPRIIIIVFLLALFLAAPVVGVSVPGALSDILIRVGMNGIMVLALVPMIQSGCGLNFGLSLGVIAGLLGATMSIEMGLVGAFGFIIAIVISQGFGAVFGYGYGKLLNRVKGGEMMISTYVGFSSVMLMSIAWLILPYKDPTMIWGYGGSGLRTTISVEGFWRHILDDLWAIQLGDDFKVPTGALLVFLAAAGFIWAFFHLKLGTAMTAVGSNPVYARASGINIDRMRIISVVMSTMLAAMGIVDAGAAPGPFAGRAAKQRMGNGRGRGGVANPHLAHHQQVRNRILGGRLAPGRAAADFHGVVAQSAGDSGHHGRTGPGRQLVLVHGGVAVE